MLRVTAPGGMLLVCEFSHPQNPRSRASTGSTTTGSCRRRAA
jgi:ubiquinone/menaquinone biosynthesis C-methylase UbiE